MLQFIKMGSNTLFDENDEINHSLLEKKAREIEESEYDNVLVLSGAIKLGKKKLSDAYSSQPNAKIPSTKLQQYASIGQPILMNLMDKYFTKPVSQVLLTTEGLRHENHLKDLIYQNISDGIKTIINYNDSIDFEELRKDNDTLASILATYCNADRLIILGKYDGFMDQNGGLIERIADVNDAMYKLCREKSFDGNGGFESKLDAAKRMLEKNKEVIISNIAYELQDIIEGNVPRTVFKKY